MTNHVCSHKKLKNGVSDVLAFNYSRQNSIVLVNHSGIIFDLCPNSHKFDKNDMVLIDLDDAENMGLLSKPGITTVAKFQNNQRVSIT